MCFAINTRSQHSASEAPSPTAGPLTAATTGSRKLIIACRMSDAWAEISYRRARERCCAFKKAKSPPPLKVLPAPVSTTQRAPASRSRSRQTSRSLWCRVALTTLRSSGRLIVTMRTAPSAVTRSSSLTSPSLLTRGSMPGFFAMLASIAKIAVALFRGGAPMTETSDHRCYERLFIGGHWREPSTRNRIAVISPHSEEPIGEDPAPAPADVDAAVAAARDAFDHGPWPRLNPSERMGKVEELAKIYSG